MTELEVDIKGQNLLLYCNSNPIQHKNQNQLRDLQKNIVLHFTSSYTKFYLFYLKLNDYFFTFCSGGRGAVTKRGYQMQYRMLFREKGLSETMKKCVSS